MVGRAGLGNMLFPWARAEVFAASRGISLISPQWVQPKVGPILRGERDWRFYAGLFDNGAGGYVRGLRRLWLLAVASRIQEQQACGGGDCGERSKHRPRLIVFRGTQGWFDNLLPHREFVAQRLRGILSEEVRRRLTRAPKAATIAVHIRRGDKRPLDYGEPLSGASWQTVSLRWYIQAIRSVRAALGTTAAVKVYTDATAAQLEPLLLEPAVELAPAQPAIVDMLLMADAKVLIATGGSSFSAWSSYLGAMPTLWYPDSGLRLCEGSPELCIETDLAGHLATGAGEVLAQFKRQPGGLVAQEAPTA